MPALSVLLPVKDGAATIRGAVRSTLLAMPRSGELLVVDDGSTDGTGDVLAAISDPRLRVVRHEQPHGVAASLNEALERTDGEAIGRMDGDDLSLPWRFRRQLPALRTTDLVFGSMVLIDGRGRPIGASSPTAIGNRVAPLHLLLENPFAHPTLVARRDALVQAGGYRTTPVEDYDLWLRATAAGTRMRKLRTPVLAYRRHAGQATRGWRPETPDPLLDESYAALLPPHLRPAAAALRTAAVFRDPALAGPAWAVLLDHLRSAAEALPAKDRRRLLDRLTRR